MGRVAALLIRRRDILGRMCHTRFKRVLDSLNNIQPFCCVLEVAYERVRIISVRYKRGSQLCRSPAIVKGQVTAVRRAFSSTFLKFLTPCKIVLYRCRAGLFAIFV